MDIILSDKFLGRVEEFSDYISLDDIPTAIRWAREIVERCDQLKDHPQSGRNVPEFNRTEIRELIYGNYRIIYEVKKDQVVVLTLWHASQKMPDEPGRI